LTLSAHAVTLDMAAPYDTLTLVGTARNALGQPLAGAPAPTFTSSDSSVRVSAQGVLQARAVVGQVMVIAQLVYQGIRVADTTYVNVTSAGTLPTFTALQLASADGHDSLPLPVLPFSAFYSPPAKDLVVAALDSSSTPIPGALVALRLSVPATQVTVPAVTSTGSAQVTVAGRSVLRPFWVYAEATVYGVTHRDSLQLTLTTPQLFEYFVDSLPAGGAAVTPTQPVPLGVGGAVWWVNHVSSATGDSLDVIFDDPSAVAADPVLSAFGIPAAGGDITSLEGCADLLSTCINVASRQFPVAGTYHWRSVRLGVSGTIIVK
jgi:hypothetical protein